MKFVLSILVRTPKAKLGNMCDKYHITRHGCVRHRENSAFGRVVLLTDKQVTKFVAAGLPPDFVKTEGL